MLKSKSDPLVERLNSIEKRYEEINALMVREEVTSDLKQLQGLAQEQASIKNLAAKYREYKAVDQNLAETREMRDDGLDGEMSDLIRDEIVRLEAHRENLLREIRMSLKPRDPSDHKDVIIEIRAGTGGNEAALFAGDLFRTYSRYALARGWSIETLSTNETGIGGFKEIIFEIKGKGAFSRLKYERGVHRVQRVPLTESGGRIHTSTATVAVLPKVDEIEVNINPEDLRIDTFRSSGAGGQSVNKVSSAVRITHIPTGMVVICQDERSQFKNKMRALSVLRARLYDQEHRKQIEEVTANRRSQVGSGDRAEKIRTYNFPQSRITDHRIGLTLHNLRSILDGGLDELIDALAVAEF
ncbi:MAG: peptide chain release factor 1 [Dehalococcoidia bacterium]|nr:Peptide chain release factor 1 [Chloroflexota bacterium]MBT9161029.1 Peptide chain release factor 1 [Chloroflexota bacterium]MBT9162400.1 Peptide chain release factor 1 [Chloroflexota bacterium]